MCRTPGALAAGAFACFCAALFGAGCARGGEALYIYNWTYYCPDSVIERFEKEYGVKVVYDQYASNEEMYAKIQAGGAAWDLVFPSADYMAMMTRQGMLAKIDHGMLPNLANVDPAVAARADWDPGMEYFVPYYYGAAGVCVNTKRVPAFDDSWKSWDIFARAAYRGRMTMLDDMRMVLGNAMISLGYGPNETDPDVIDRARDLVNDAWKPNLTRFDSEAFGKGYAGEDFWIVYGFFEGIREETGSGGALLADTAFFLPREGAAAYLDGMCVLKNARHPELAHKFIDFMHRPEVYAEFCDYFHFPATANVPARALQKETPFVSAEELLGNTRLMYDVGEAIEYYNEAWFDMIRIGE